MIEVRNLTKKYGSAIAVDNISFDIEPGNIYGLLGPNGAGKSTTMNIITGCLAATEGTVKINGYDIAANPLQAKKCIGYLPEIPPLYTGMTPYEYLVFVAEAKKTDYDVRYRQIKEAMELTGIEEVSDKIIKNLSKGYRQRVGIAQAMLGNPDIIILDEPTVGLDPRQIIGIRDLIRMLGETKTVILSSHILAEIAEVCNRVIIINKGKIVADDTLENLNSFVSPTDILNISVRGNEQDITSVLDSIDGILSRESLAVTEEGIYNFRLEAEKKDDMRDTIFFAMAKKECAVIEMEKEKSSLESIFLDLVDRDNVDRGKGDAAQPQEENGEASEPLKEDDGAKVQPDESEADK